MPIGVLSSYRDCFFVKIVKKLGGCQGNHYLCIII